MNMKAWAMVAWVLLLAITGYLVVEVRGLKAVLAELSAAPATTVVEASALEAIPAPPVETATERPLTFAEAERLFAGQLDAVDERLAEEREVLAMAQLQALESFVESEALEARLWAMVQGFILDFMHPENMKAMEAEIEAQHKAYAAEDLRRHPQKAVTNNLRQIASAGQQYILEEGASSVTYSQLEGEYFAPITPINGENYHSIVLSENGGTLRVTMADGTVVEYTY